MDSFIIVFAHDALQHANAAGHGKRQLRANSGAEQVVTILFGLAIMMGVAWLAYQGRLSEQRRLEDSERERRDAIEKHEREIEERRRAVLGLVVDNGVTTVLTEDNFRVVDEMATAVRSTDGVSQEQISSPNSNNHHHSTTATTISSAASLSAVDIEMGKIYQAQSIQSATPTSTLYQGGNVVVLPRREASQSSSLLGPRIFEPVCAICLEPYRVGDNVVWSMNKTCQHMFDRDCLLDYLMQHQDGALAPCPCCRKVFLIPADDDNNGEDDNELEEEITKINNSNGDGDERSELPNSNLSTTHDNHIVFERDP